ncbi:MAG: hypothetical protein WCL11_26580, partial [Verrucomicrobiota bacterium]
MTQQSPFYQTNTSFTITVTNATPPITPPSLTLPFTQTNIPYGTTLTFTAYATNTDNSLNALTFSLGAGAPTGAAISDSFTNGGAQNYNSGVFTWTPTSFQAGNRYSINLVVTEKTNQAVLATSSQSFTVNVAPQPYDCSQYTNFTDFVAAVNSGSPVLLSACDRIVVSNTIVINSKATILGETNVLLTTGTEQMRHFTVQAGGILTLSNLTLSRGRSIAGGAIYVMEGGKLKLMDCTFAGNVANGLAGMSGTAGDGSDPNYGKGGGDALFGWMAAGGAICNLGTLDVYS